MNDDDDDTKKVEAALRGQAAERAAAWEADRPDRERRVRIAQLKAELDALTKVEREAEKARVAAAKAEEERRAAEAQRLKWAPFVGATIESVTETGDWNIGYYLNVHTSAGTLEIPGNSYDGSYEEVEIAIRPKKS